MPDLFGKPDPKPYIAPDPFYCYQCAGTHSRKCKDCGKRICVRHGIRCDACDIKAWDSKQQTKAARHVSKLIDKLGIKTAGGGDEA